MPAAMRPIGCGVGGKQFKRASLALDHRLRPSCRNEPGRLPRRGRGKVYREPTACSGPDRSRIRDKHHRGHVTGKGKSEAAWQRTCNGSVLRLS